MHFCSYDDDANAYYCYYYFLNFFLIFFFIFRTFDEDFFSF